MLSSASTKEYSILHPLGLALVNITPTVVPLIFFVLAFSSTLMIMSLELAVTVLSPPHFSTILIVADTVEKGVVTESVDVNGVPSKVS